MRPESLDFLKAIVNVPSPSGFEEHAAEIYRNYSKPFADDVQTDVHGNVAGTGARLLQGTARKLTVEFWETFARRAADLVADDAGSPAKEM